MLDAERSEMSTHVVGRRGLIAGSAGLFVGASALVANGEAAATGGGDTGPGRPVPADVYADICQLKANYVTATDSLPFPDSADRASSCTAPHTRTMLRPRRAMTRPYLTFSYTDRTNCSRRSKPCWLRSGRRSTTSV